MKLLAVLEVDPSQSVPCQEEGCGHAVYKRIHVCQTEKGIILMGSTCFQKRYDSTPHLSFEFAGNGSGRLLTESEASILKSYPEDLIAHFQAEAETNRKRELERLEQMRQQISERQAQFDRSREHLLALRLAEQKPVATLPPLPWKWIRPMSSMAYFHFGEGEGWCRVQHADGAHFIMPWPATEGWDESLPPSVGVADLETGGYRVRDLLGAIAFLRKGATWERVGIWREIAEEIQRRAGLSGGVAE